MKYNLDRTYEEDHTLLIMKKIIIIFVMIFNIVLIFSLEIGDGAPKFVNPDLNAKYILSKNIIGKGWIILDFFATDCDGCKKELPEIEELYRVFKDYGLFVVVFAVDEEGPSIVKPYFEEHPTELLVVIDRYKKTAIQYDVDEIPTLYLVNPEGIIVKKQVEYAKENMKELREMLSSAYLPGEDIEPESGSDPDSEDIDEEIPTNDNAE